MSLLLLKEIGKIYASEAAIAVGIRGVNLSFDKGEFVAVTGKSGSGKSTLLNVISGMDTYEEGEMFIEGEPTSHYQQSDWEEYRHKYISFVFQDYNIIDSFTVLENVELALMYIEDAKERRKKAVELLTRVGMEKFLRQRGSKLSGGQKQRTVIARALAKDSPIILADEPTGNLDSATAKEIIKLLYEVSRDKLLIIVTHSFDQVEEYATRQIRIYDGGVEFDHEENADKEKGEQNPDKCGYNTVNDEKTVGESAEKKKKSRFMVRVQNGFILGFAIFKAMPRLTVFMSLMMILGAIGIFISTTVFGTGRLYDSTPYMFVPYEGRVIIVKQTGEIPTSEELSEWTNGSKEISAKSLLRCDYLLDSGISVQFENAQNGLRSNLNIIATFNEDFGKNVIGRYPSAEDEALLYLPIYMQPYFGKEADKIIKVSNISYPVTVVGIKYYYDNNLSPKILFTEEGFETHTAIAFAISSQLSLNFSV
ncbi:MAG: ABC transporter ATP-binding protein, partial [Clostridia bacterium]|nr:ABC transporter ATP-binding protein [Clostridia bacterium]